MKRLRQARLVEQPVPWLLFIGHGARQPSGVGTRRSTSP